MFPDWNQFLSRMMKAFRILFFCVTTSLLSYSSMGQTTNYDENKVPDYHLPEVLTSESGQGISDKEQWEKIRRPEILELFSKEMFGTIPSVEVDLSFEVKKHLKGVLDGAADLKEVDLIFSNSNGRDTASLLLFLPSDRSQPVPLFLGLNFYGNHTIHAHPEISISKNYTRNNPTFYIYDHQADENSRGVRSTRWPVEYILQNGYGLGVIYYGDLDPDFDDGYQNGLHPLFYKEGQERPAEEEWGSIGVWAWGMSRALDYLEQDPDIAADKVISFGHSRLGKTSLWAGAQDERFAAVISNNSGCGGAAISRRRFGETVKVINTSFPHWFNDVFRKYNEKEDELPLDQHMLIALMAPRPVYIASAQQDQWADPKGEYLSGYHAGPVYQLYGKMTPSSENQPPLNQPQFTESVSYHIRSGVHDVTRFDWVQYIQFANQYVR